jgi:hypothetical protein
VVCYIDRNNVLINKKETEDINLLSSAFFPMLYCHERVFIVFLLSLSGLYSVK